MGKMVRLFTCLLAIFFIFFASVPVSYASLEKNPLQFELIELKFITSSDGSHYAQGYMRWGNISPYEIHDLKGSIDLVNGKGQKIGATPKTIDSYHLEAGDNDLGLFDIENFDLAPFVTHPSQIEGAYLKPTYTFTLGKKAEFKPNVIFGKQYHGMDQEKFYFRTFLLNQGEATATNFKYSGVSITDKKGLVHFYSETTHPVVNSSLRLEPGQYVYASFDIPLDFINSNVGKYEDIDDVSITYTHESSAPYIDNAALNVTVDNKKLVQQTFVENDVTYVSLRELADILGATIQWDDSTQTATLIEEDTWQGENKIIIPVGSNRFVHNGYPTTASAKAKLHNNTVLVVPLRDVVEMMYGYFDFEHKWGRRSIIVVPYTPDM
ncbi:hypothetical protein BBR47_22760 [Brevibacillus brevis NBRC 100599]|uniref:Copper amine oxidase-like N-terminal domain-containing protein n=1 Tax=Brevibacillus brevis (strain 47 / JCM 6285 / NBRC 100599) TaxID=358681 RepID=C0ZBU4_BREBN|nr:copper amine oxidase N-terminal domain-containing protein [Brevibacillus brevis]BAH43253.1 hypothetical protein BBR47_22760 [Brevibacillus brevis NBRC 100599]